MIIKQTTNQQGKRESKKIVKKFEDMSIKLPENKKKNREHHLNQTMNQSDGFFYIIIK